MRLNSGSLRPSTCEQPVLRLAFTGEDGRHHQTTVWSTHRIGSHQDVIINADTEAAQFYRAGVSLIIKAYEMMGCQVTGAMLLGTANTELL